LKSKDFYKQEEQYNFYNASVSDPYW